MTQRKPSRENPGLKSPPFFFHLGDKQSPERRRIYGAGGGEGRVPRVPRHTALLSDCTLASIAGALLTEPRFGTSLLNVSLAAGHQLSQFPPTARERWSPRIGSTLRPFPCFVLFFLNKPIVAVITKTLLWLHLARETFYMCNNAPAVCVNDRTHKVRNT